MPTAPAPLQPTTPPQTPAAPLLFTFLAGILAVVGLVLAIASGLTWALVGITIATILAFTVLVLVVAERLMSDADRDERAP